MVSKNTILTKNRLKFIEDVIATSGRVVTPNDIRNAVSKKYSKFALRKRINESKSKGWFVPLKRGLYFIADITSHGFVDVSPFVIANAYNKDTYISLDSAFSYYNLIEQMLRTTTSITKNRTKRYKFQGHNYQFLKIRRNLYFGSKSHVIDGYYVKIAELEKAILDYLYFRNDTYTIDLLIEILQKIKDKLDLKKLFIYAKKFPEASKRKIGFLLDLLNMDTSVLYKSVKRSGYSKFTSNSRKFNSKWRIYYENRFTK